MEIIVEIGDQEIQEKIANEIEVLVAELYEDLEVFPKFIVPNHFTDTVKRLTMDSSYSGERVSTNQSVLGITLKPINSVVINPGLYTERFDAQIRSIVYHHEMSHYNYPLNIITKNNPNKTDEYLAFVNKFFEEYSACESGLSVTKSLFKEPSKKLEDYVKKISEGHYKNLKNEEIYHFSIDTLIDSFKTGKITLEDFLGSLIPIIHNYTTELISCLSFRQVYPEYFIIDIEQDHLFNKSSYDFLEYLKSIKLPLKENREMIDTLDNYFKNFGLSLTDLDNGIYYTVNYIRNSEK